MEKMSRVKKYRDLRESLNDDATLPKQEIKENDVEEDDFYIPTLKEYRQKQQTEKSVFFETSEILQNEIDQESIENIEKAISRVRVTSGKGDSYNTRLDILNQISGAPKKDSHEITSNSELEVEDNGFKTTSEFELEPIIFESDEDQFKTEETKKIIQDTQNENESFDEEEFEEENTEEEPGIMMKVLTGLIVILTVCLVCLLVYLAKLFLF